jgi:hypothetical protein
VYKVQQDLLVNLVQQQILEPQAKPVILAQQVVQAQLDLLAKQDQLEKRVIQVIQA